MRFCFGKPNLETSMKKTLFNVGIAVCLCTAAVTAPTFADAPMPEVVKGRPVGGPRSIRLTPEQMGIEMQIGQLDEDGLAAQKAGRYAEAVDDARQSIDIGQDSGLAQEILAYSLNAQGKSPEALEAYKKIVEMNGKSARTYDLIPYAQLLLQLGQWAKAVAVYNQAWPNATANDSLPPLPGPFLADVPQPKELATVLHISRGLVGSRWGSPARGEEAMTQFSAALKLMPDDPLVNFYYGHGWQNLAPIERAKMAARPGQREAMKAALEKAATLGTGDVQTQAKAELKQLW